MSGPTRGPDALLEALAQMGALKTLARAGWRRRGIADGESVADHVYRAALLALVLEDRLGAGVDVDRLARLLLVHDLAESDPSVGDLTPFCGIGPEEKRRRERAAIERLAATIPEWRSLLPLWREYDEALTPEACLAHELDALEMALQSREYEPLTGLDLSEFRESARAKVRHPALRAILEALDEPR